MKDQRQGIQTDLSRRLEELMDGVRDEDIWQHCWIRKYISI